MNVIAPKRTYPPRWSLIIDELQERHVEKYGHGPHREKPSAQMDAYLESLREACQYGGLSKEEKRMLSTASRMSDGSKQLFGYLIDKLASQHLDSLR